MRYVSSIAVKGRGMADSLTFPMGYPGRGIEITTTDLDTGAVSMLSAKQVGEENVLGCAKNVIDGTSAVIRYSEHQARLHSYLESAVMTAGTDVLNATGADICEKSTRGVGLEEHAGNKRLVVDTVMTTIGVCGLSGSVAFSKIGYSGNIRICPLYDFLCEISKEFGVSLMRYEEVQLYSRLASYTTTIRFSQTPEAQRFLTKMAIDAFRGVVMRYISGIETNAGMRSSILYPVNNPEKGMRLFVHDTETGLTRAVANKGVLSQDCLGVAGDVTAFKAAIVKYDSVSSMLYRYVEEAFTVIGVDSLNFSGADVCTVGDEFAKAPGNTRVIINTVRDRYRLCGKFGSVAASQSSYNGMIVIGTLYSLLGSLCRKYSINLMGYEVIQLYSKLSSYTTTIKLSRSPEAMRFFMKMYLEVSREVRV